METKKLLALIQAVRIGSINKAAEELGYTQSGLTYILNTMENEFGIKLISRDHNGIGLTPAGTRLLPALEQILEDERVFYKQLDLIKSGGTKQIRIGTYSSLMLSWLPHVISSFKKKYPDVNFEIRTGVTQIKNWLDRDEVDLALCEEFTCGDHPWEYIADDEMCVAVNTDLPLSQEETITLEKLKDYDVIFPAILKKNAVTARLDELGIEYKRQTMLYTDDGSITLSMVANQKAVSFLTKMYRPECPENVVLRSAVPKIYRQLGVAINVKRQSDATINKFVKFMKKLEFIY